MGQVKKKQPKFMQLVSKMDYIHGRIIYNTIYALDTDGEVWYLEDKTSQERWIKVTNERYIP